MGIKTPRNPGGIKTFSEDEILAFAEEVDLTGERRLGILTKPDLLKEHSAKAVVCELVLGKRRPLTLGYYVVRSRGGDEEDSNGDADLLQREDIFKDKPWTSLPDHKTGIKALRECLQELLGQIADKAFPKLRSETRRKLTEKQEELASLGPPRQTGRQQQQFLVSTASKFQNIVRAALDANYSTHQAFADDSLRLITEIVNMTDEFAFDFQECAHTYEFNTAYGMELIFSEIPQPKRARPILSDSEDVEDAVDEESSTCLDLNLYPDLEGILTKDWTSHQPSEGIMPWITQMHRRSRGVELGTFGPRVLSSAFQEQSIYWQNMITQYLSKVIFSVHKFILEALAKVCHETRVLDELISGLMDDLLARYRDGMNQAIHLVHIERHKKPYTLNYYFNENLQKARNDRTNKALEKKAWNDQQTGLRVVQLNNISSVVNNQSNIQHTAEEIHDILYAYYKVARKRFVDNIYHQAVDHCLLSGPSNPLILFCEQWVLNLSDEKLRLIASESRVTQERRQNLETALQDLAQAIEILELGFHLEKMAHDNSNAEPVPIQGGFQNKAASKKPSSYIFDSKGDTQLILRTYKDQPFIWTAETIWIGQKSRKKFSKKKKEKKTKEKAAFYPPPASPPPQALPKSPISIQPSLWENMDSFSNVAYIRPEFSDKETMEQESADAGKNADSSSPRIQDCSYGERSGILPDQVEIQMLVSGKHLELASSYFKKMFSGPFMEGKADHSGLRRVTASNWDPEAFNIVLTIMHGYHRDVPRSLGLEMLAKLAMIVDYYDCHEIIELYADICGKLIEAEDCFPIPSDLLEQIDIARQDYLNKVFSATYDLLDRLQEQPECSYECSSMLLGVLTKELKNHGILSPRSELPFYGLSIEGSKDMIKGFKVPHWYDSSGGRYGPRHPCTIQQKLSVALEKADKELRVFDLQDFQPARPNARPSQEFEGV
ncbi:dynamin family [Fusarium beomiforme]|uniref:Dynamin family n=1 Tax=Fusarium beomiforme TaxID=44412 RepID=A0A9P5AGD5_9HYPO|nr:dynamin family [Fusarium beomiforme]